MLGTGVSINQRSDKVVASGLMETKQKRGVQGVSQRVSRCLHKHFTVISRLETVNSPGKRRAR